MKKSQKQVNPEVKKSINKSIKVTNNIHEISGHVDELSHKPRPKSHNINYSKFLMGKAFEKFQSRINNDVTRQRYTYRLYQVCEKLGLTTEQLCDKYSKKDCTELEDQFIELINRFKKENKIQEYDSHSGTIYMQYFAFKKFCEANRIMINSKYLAGELPKKPNNSQDKAYSKEQIIMMLNNSDPRSRLIILLLATSGMRVGALCTLRMGEISPKNSTETDELEAGIIIIYKNDNEQDTIFCTPECYNAYLSYKRSREELGEKITSQSPVILRRIPPDRKHGWTEIKTISASTLSNILVNVAKRAGIRQLSDSYKHSNRYVTKITTGFRKYFETTVIDAKYPVSGTNKIDPYRADRLLSHSRRGGIQLTKHYDKSEMLPYYIKVIPDLTFSREAEYKAKYQQAENEIQGLEQAKNYIQQKEKEVNDLNARLAKMEEIVGGRLAKTSHMLSDIPHDVKNVDEWFDRIRRGKNKPKFSEPKEELIPTPETEELLAEEYSVLEDDLKRAKKQKNKKRVTEIESRMKEIESLIMRVEV